MDGELNGKGREGEEDDEEEEEQKKRHLSGQTHDFPKKAARRRI